MDSLQSTSAGPPNADRSPLSGRCPATRGGFPAASTVSIDRQSTLLRLVTARRAAQHQQMFNGDCAPATSAVVPTYGVETTNEDALRQVRRTLLID